MLTCSQLRVIFLVCIAILLIGGACDIQRTTRKDCEQLIDTIVALEFRQLGYRDPVLLARRQKEIRQLFKDQMERCVGQRKRSHLRDCIQSATDTKQLIKRCL